SRRRHTRSDRDWSSDVCSSDLRGLAATANHFARESHMDELADALALDPLEFRRRNIKDPRLRAVLDAAAARFGWGAAPRSEKGRSEERRVGKGGGGGGWGGRET